MGAGVGPDQITFYRIQKNHGLSIQQVTDEITKIGRIVEKLEIDEIDGDEGSSFRFKFARKFQRAIEEILEENEHESFVIQVYNAPYDIEFLSNAFEIALCSNPFIAMAVFRGSKQVIELLYGMQELANHEYFDGGQDAEDLGRIKNFLESSLVDGSEKCAIVAILEPV